MNGLCAPSTISTDERLEMLLKERANIDKRIGKVISIQNQETGIAANTMDDVVEWLIEVGLECSDNDSIKGYISDGWELKSYRKVLQYVYDYECEDEPCIKKMLKEHANHILLSK